MGVGVAVRASTLGYGFDAAVPVAQKANIRAGFNFLGVSEDFDDDGITIKSKLKLRSFVTQLDWYPFGGGFHLSPGVMLYNGNKVEATTAVPAGRTFSIGDSNEDLISNPANPVLGAVKVEFPKVAPTLVLGWGNLVPRGNRKWSIPFELGIVYSRAPTAVFSLTGSACSTNGQNCRDLATDAGLQRDITDEQDQLNDDLSPLTIYPVVSVGFSWRF